MNTKRLQTLLEEKLVGEQVRSRMDKLGQAYGPTLARYMIDFMVGNALRVPSAADQIALFGDVVKVTVEKVT